MSALLKKEFRLLLSAWIAAMLLAIAPLPLGPVFRYGVELAVGLTFYTAILGCLILGTVGFGREFESHTFSLLLVQPWQRREFWRAKITALLLALLPLGLWLLVIDLICVPSHQRWLGALLWLAVASAVITGGLWTTLLLRQFFSAFWISILLPLAIIFATMALWGERISEEVGSIIIGSLLLIYSIAGYFLARWLFRTAQDTQWTGGELTLSGITQRLWWKPAAAKAAKTHPLGALFRKELHLHESSLLAAGLLLILQVMSLLISRMVKHPDDSFMGVLPQLVWFLWLLMPVLVGCTGVAEERKLGMLESQLCLPAARSRQFMVKVFVTMMLGIVLGAVVPILTWPLDRTGAFHNVGWLQFAGAWSFACFGVTMVCFYGSSLARYWLHAFGVAVAFVLFSFVFGGWLVGAYSQGIFAVFGVQLWRGPLALLMAVATMLLFAMGLTWRRLRWVWVGFVILISLAFYRGLIQSYFEAISVRGQKPFGLDPGMVITLVLALGPTSLLLALAGRNFKHAKTDKFLWQRNAITWAGCLVVTTVLTALVYNRVWERWMEFEPRAGTPRLSGPVEPNIASAYQGARTFVLLPDGRLCWFGDYNWGNRTDTQAGDDSSSSFDGFWRPIANPRIEFVAGSNWVAIAGGSRGLIGLKSDGSLAQVFWGTLVLGRLSQPLRPSDATPARPENALDESSPRVERIGNESDWMAIAASSFHFVALKRDGTILGWGDNALKPLGNAPRFVHDAPVRIGHESDWTNVFAGPGRTFAIKRDGSIWAWGRGLNDGRSTDDESSSTRLNLHVKEVRTIISTERFDLVLDTDDNVWFWGDLTPFVVGRRTISLRAESAPQRLSQSKWVAVCASDWRGVAGLKQDGSLWDERVDSYFERQKREPVRLGKRNDWIAISMGGTFIGSETVLALAKDGALCRFGDVSWLLLPELLAPTRRVTWSVNVLSAAK